MLDYITDLSLIDLIEFIVGLATGGGLCLTFKKIRDKSSNKVNQKGNYSEGNIAGRDINNS